MFEKLCKMEKIKFTKFVCIAVPYKHMAQASFPYTKLVIISVHEFAKTKTQLQRKFMLMQIPVM